MTETGEEANENRQGMGDAGESGNRLPVLQWDKPTEQGVKGQRGY